MSRNNLTDSSSSSSSSQSIIKDPTKDFGGSSSPMRDLTMSPNLKELDQRKLRSIYDTDPANQNTTDRDFHTGSHWKDVLARIADKIGNGAGTDADGGFRGADNMTNLCGGGGSTFMDIFAGKS